jgi:hypothetical protein
VRVTPGEIKTRHGFHGFHGFVKIFSIQYRGAFMTEPWASALHYLTATGLRPALLLNLRARSLQFKRIIRQVF